MQSLLCGFCSSGQRFARGLIDSPHPASFRFHLAMDTLAFGYILPATGRIRDFHPLERAPAGRTIKNADPSEGAAFSYSSIHCAKRGACYEAREHRASRSQQSYGLKRQALVASEHAEHYTRRYTGADNSGYVGSHGMHEKEVGWVGLLTLHL